MQELTITELNKEVSRILTELRISSDDWRIGLEQLSEISANITNSYIPIYPDLPLMNTLFLEKSSLVSLLIHFKEYHPLLIQKEFHNKISNVLNKYHINHLNDISYLLNHIKYFFQMFNKSNTKDVIVKEDKRNIEFMQVKEFLAKLKYIEDGDLRVNSVAIYYQIKNEKGKLQPAKIEFESFQLITDAIQGVENAIANFDNFRLTNGYNPKGSKRFAKDKSKSIFRICLLVLHHYFTKYTSLIKESENECLKCIGDLMELVDLFDPNKHTSPVPNRLRNELKAAKEKGLRYYMLEFQ